VRRRERREESSHLPADSRGDLVVKNRLRLPKSPTHVPLSSVERLLTRAILGRDVWKLREFLRLESSCASGTRNGTDGVPLRPQPTRGSPRSRYERVSLRCASVIFTHPRASTFSDSVVHGFLRFDDANRLARVVERPRSPVVFPLERKSNNRDQDVERLSDPSSRVLSPSGFRCRPRAVDKYYFDSKLPTDSSRREYRVDLFPGRARKIAAYDPLFYPPFISFRP